MLGTALRDVLTVGAGRTVALAFALNGFLFANWFARIPAVQADLGLSAGELGLALLALPVGSLAIMPFTGWLAARFGAGRVTLVAALFCALGIPLPAWAGSMAGLAVALCLLGVATAAMDVAMNAAAAALEQQAGRSIMVTFHALFSLGGIVGALVGGLAAAIGLGPLPHLALIGTAGAVAVLARWDTLADPPRPTGSAGPVLAVPRGPYLGLALIAGATMLGEGAAADWSAVYIASVLGGSAFAAALGYAAFATGMTLARFMGDQAIDRWGDVALVRGGALLAALGLGLGLLVPSTPAAALGFACLGLGFAAIVPIAFRTAATLRIGPPGAGLAAVATVGYSGFLVGPPLIGLLAELTGLRAALLVVPALALLIAGPGGAFVARLGASRGPERA